MKRTPVVDENGNGETIVGKIEKGIPVPEERTRTGAKYNFSEMKKGDSRLITNEHKKENVLRNILYNSIASYRKKHPEKKFIVRKDPEHKHSYRIWRTK